MATDDFFRARLDQMIDMSHPLVVLARRMPWAQIEASLARTLLAALARAKRWKGLICLGLHCSLPGLVSVLQGVRACSFA